MYIPCVKYLISNNLIFTQGRIVLMSGRQWLLMIQGSESKDYSILAPVMDQIEKSESISKLKKIGNVNSDQGRMNKPYLYLPIL